MRTFIVYMHVNKINGKRYIGITCLRPNKRWGLTGNGYKNCTCFYNAILKYGWENFEHIILFDNVTKVEAKQHEIRLIAEYHTYIGDPECWGYNMTLGGEGSPKYATIEEKIARHKESRRKYLDKNKDYFREYNRQRGIAKKEMISASKRNWRENNLEHVQQYKQQYAEEHKVELFEWRQTRDEELKTMRKQIQALNKAFPTVLSEEEQFKLARRDRCRNKPFLAELLAKFNSVTNELTQISAL